MSSHWSHYSPRRRAALWLLLQSLRRLEYKSPQWGSIPEGTWVCTDNTMARGMGTRAKCSWSHHFAFPACSSDKGSRRSSRHLCSSQCSHRCIGECRTTHQSLCRSAYSPQISLWVRRLETHRSPIPLEDCGGHPWPQAASAGTKEVHDTGTKPLHQMWSDIRTGQRCCHRCRLQIS